jgi:hypothetical protein
VSPFLAEFVLSEPAEIKARRLPCGGEYHDQIENPGLNLSMAGVIIGFHDLWSGFTLVSIPRNSDRITLISRASEASGTRAPRWFTWAVDFDAPTSRKSSNFL